MFKLSSTTCFNEAFKFTPMHPSTKRLIDAIHVVTDGKVEAAKALDQSSATITNWKARGVSKEGRLKAHAKYGISPTWIETGEGPMLATGATSQAQSTSGVAVVTAGEPATLGATLARLGAAVSKADVVTRETIAKLVAEAVMNPATIDSAAAAIEALLRYSAARVETAALLPQEAPRP